MPARRPHTAPGRDRILDAALAAFAERGYHATSIAEIGERAGVAKSVLYHHFGSKAGLYAAILETQTQDLVARVGGALPPDEDAPRLRAGLDAYLAFLAERPLVWELLFRDPPLDDELRAAYDAQQRERAAALTALIARPAASRTGAARKDVYTGLLITAVRSFASWWHEHPETPREQVLDAILAFAEAGADNLR